MDITLPLDSQRSSRREMAPLTIDEQMVTYEQTIRKKNQDPEDEEFILESIEEYRAEITEKKRLKDLAATATKEEEGCEFKEESYADGVQEVSEPVVLLCDGEGCSGEMSLTDAGLQSVPEGDWFCPKCTKRRGVKRSRSRQGPRSGVAGKRMKREKTVADHGGSESGMVISEVCADDDKSVPLLTCNGCEYKAAREVKYEAEPNGPDSHWYCRQCSVDKANHGDKVSTAAAFETLIESDQALISSASKSSTTSSKTGSITATPAEAVSVVCAAPDVSAPARSPPPHRQSMPTGRASSAEKRSVAPKVEITPINSPLPGIASNSSKAKPSNSTSVKRKSSSSSSSIRKNKRAQQGTPSAGGTRHLAQKTMWQFLKICNPVPSGHFVDLSKEDAPRGNSAHADLVDLLM